MRGVYLVIYFERFRYFLVLIYYFGDNEGIIVYRDIWVDFVLCRFVLDYGMGTFSSIDICIYVFIL